MFGLQVRRAACSARRVKPYCILAFGNTAFSDLLGEAKGSKNGAQTWASWVHVGTFFALGRLFFALGWFLNVFCTFLAHVGRFFRALGRPGLDFGSSGPGFRAFKTTFGDVFWRWHARVAEMLIMQQNHSFCDVL